MSDTEFTDPAAALHKIVSANGDVSAPMIAPGGDPDKGTTIALRPAAVPPSPSFIDLGQTEMVRPPYFGMRRRTDG